MKIAKFVRFMIRITSPNDDTLEVVRASEMPYPRVEFFEGIPTSGMFDMACTRVKCNDLLDKYNHLSTTVIGWSEIWKEYYQGTDGEWYVPGTANPITRIKDYAHGIDRPQEELTMKLGKLLIAKFENLKKDLADKREADGKPCRTCQSEHFPEMKGCFCCTPEDSNWVAMREEDWDAIDRDQETL